MTRINWGETGTRVFQAGIDRGVLYVDGNQGVPWVGLIAVNESPNGGEAKPRYLDGIKISNRSTPEEFKATIEAFTYPLEFERCDGTYMGENGLRIKQQKRLPFGISYRSLVGNDVSGLSLGYQIHVVYNLKAAPSNRGYQTLTNQSEPATFNWEVTSRAAPVSGFRPSSHFVFDSRDVPAELMQQLEDLLYGTETLPSTLPTPGELMFLFDSFNDLVYDAGDPYTPAFVTYDAGTPATSVIETIDGGAL
jgi:hypothetical protein